MNFFTASSEWHTRQSGEILKCSFCMRFERFRVPAHRNAPARQQKITVKIELPGSRNLRIKNAHGSSRRVARIREAFSALLLLLFVQRLKGAQRHDDFAANLKIRGKRSFLSSAASTRSGIERIVRTFAVTSSPVVPSPRVTPRIRAPSSYTSEMLKPSNLFSAT